MVFQVNLAVLCWRPDFYEIEQCTRARGNDGLRGNAYYLCRCSVKVDSTVPSGEELQPVVREDKKDPKEFSRGLKQVVRQCFAEKYGEEYARSKVHSSTSDDESSESASGSVAPPPARDEDHEDFGPHGHELPSTPAAVVAEAVEESEAEEPPAPTESADAEPTARYYNAMAVPNVLGAMFAGARVIHLLVASCTILSCAPRTLLSFVAMDMRKHGHSHATSC